MAKKANAKHSQDLIEDERVTSLELFFDLVFVFTLTQLTALLARSLSWETLLQAFLIFIVLFWMYGGYVWLTNSVPPAYNAPPFAKKPSAWLPLKVALTNERQPLLWMPPPCTAPLSRIVTFARNIFCRLRMPPPRKSERRLMAKRSRSRISAIRSAL